MCGIYRYAIQNHMPSQQPGHILNVHECERIERCVLQKPSMPLFKEVYVACFVACFVPRARPRAVLDDGARTAWAHALADDLLGVDQGHVQSERGDGAGGRGAGEHADFGTGGDLWPRYFMFVEVVVDPSLVVVHALVITHNVT